MNKSIFKKGTSALLAMVMCLSAFFGIGSTTAFATESTTDEVVMISFPRDGDDNLSGNWGHDELHYMNGWTASETNKITVYTVGSWTGNACYCIEPGTPLSTGDNLTKRDENYWDNYPSTYNSTISADEIKLFIGRIFQYGYTGTVNTSWRSQNADDADKLAHIMATQTLIWETVVGERDSNFNHVDTGSYDAVNDRVSTSHPLYSRYISYYNSIASNVQKHSKVPSFCAKSTSKAKNIELEWNGTNYTATLTDMNNVLSQYTFTASESGINFSVSGNKLTITAEKAPANTASITATKNGSVRKGVVVWSDGVITPGSGIQDLTTFTAEVNDPVKGYLNIKVSVGSAKIVKTSEDGKIDGITFTITGNGVDKTVTTNAKGEVQIDNLTPGVYTVTEQNYDKYEPQEVRRVTVVSGQVATVSFNNVLKRGDLVVTKTSEDGLNEGVKFHLYGTSLSGLAVNEYAVTDNSGKAYFNDVLMGTDYTLEEVDTANRYVIPEKQTATVEWNEVTNKSFTNILKKWNVTVTKSDKETGTAQGDASLAGATYGIYKGDQLIDTYMTDENGQFTTDYYVCGDDWSVREIEPSEGYLLDSSVYHIGAEAKSYTVEYNSTANDVTEQIIKGDIAIIKHTDDGSTKIETPEVGAKFEIYEDNNADGKLDDGDELIGTLTETEVGIYEMKDLLYGHYLVKETVAPDGFLLDSGVYSVFIEKDGETYTVENKADVGFINDAMRGTLKIVKTSSDGKVEGFSFRVTGANGYDKTLVTDENGEIVIEGLRIGEYTVSEVANDVSAAYSRPADKKANVMTDSTTIVEMHNVLMDNPKTGDDSNIALWLGLFGLSALGIGATVLIGKKRKKKDGEQ